MLGIKSIIFFASLIGYILLAEPAVFISLPLTHPSHPGKCWWADTSKAYSPGEVFSQASTCGQGKCHSDFSFAFESCGVEILTDPSCTKIEYDLSIPYPNCCTSYDCKNPKGKVKRLRKLRDSFKASQVMYKRKVPTQ